MRQSENQLIDRVRDRHKIVAVQHQKTLVEQKSGGMVEPQPEASIALCPQERRFAVAEAGEKHNADCKIASIW